MITEEQKQLAEKAIIEKQKEISFGLREWSIDTILDKFGEGGILILNASFSFLIINVIINGMIA